MGDNSGPIRNRLIISTNLIRIRLIIVRKSVAAGLSLDYLKVIYLFIRSLMSDWGRQYNLSVGLLGWDFVVAKNFPP